MKIEKIVLLLRRRTALAIECIKEKCKYRSYRDFIFFNTILKN